MCTLFNLCVLFGAAFESSTGMPYGTVNLQSGVQSNETAVTATAGIGTFLVEFAALSRLTGDMRFERAALRALESLWESRSRLNLVRFCFCSSNYINVDDKYVLR